MKTPAGLREARESRPPAPMDEVHVWRVTADSDGAALREVLARYLDERPTGIELRTGPHGKPALADPSLPLRFSLSHSGELALVAVTLEREIGVDVERIRPRRNLERLAERALDPAAAAAVGAAAPTDKLTAFHRAWTRREAIAKCLGTGLGVPLPPTPVAIVQLDPGSGYAAALAVAGGEVPPIRQFALWG